MNTLNLPIDLALKSFIVLALAFSAMPLLHRASAAARHMAWLLALIGAAALPVLTMVLPGWRVLPDWLRPSPSSVVAPTSPTESAVLEFSPGQTVTLNAPQRVTTPAASAPSTQHVSTVTFIWMVWAAGMTAALVPLVLAAASLRRIERRSIVLDEDAWLDLLDSSMRRLGMNQRVTLLQSCERKMPMTWGALRPRVLLPSEAESWPAQRRELALLHELAHVKRLDHLVNYVVHAACALYWFNPLVWLAARQLRLEREQASDDVVLTCGLDAGDYADELLELATTLDGAPFATVAASPMARRSTLEDRLLSILDEQRNRGALTGRKMVGGCCLLMAVLIPVSMLRGQTAAAQTATSSAVSTSTSSDASTSSGEQDIAKSYTVDSGGTLTMKVGEGDIEIAGSDANKVEVSVHRRVTHASESEAAQLLKDNEITFDQHGADIAIHSEEMKSKPGSWFHQSPNLQVTYKITTPRKYNFNLNTGGGNVTIGHVEGKTEARTAGGNVKLESIAGPVSAHTDGGNIAASDCQKLEVASGGGNLQLKELAGDVNAVTDGGSAKVENCTGALDLKSGGGNLVIDNFTGSTLKAETGGGSITADLVHQIKGNCSFESGGGNIHLKAATDLAVNLDAETGGGTVRCDLPVTTKGTIEDGSLKGTINSGGPELKIRTGGGDIKISSR